MSDKPDTARAEAANVTPFRKPVPCPQCGRQSESDSYPFCSKRCTELDLGAWFNGRYTIAVEEDDSGLPET